MDTIVSASSDVNELLRKFVDVPLKLQPKLSKLQTRVEQETDFDPPPAYWRALWEKPHLKPVQTQVKVQIQGSVVRLKSRRPKSESGATFERDWNQKPDDWGENFLLDGYDRLNPHDRAQYVKKPKIGNKSEIKEFSKNSRRNLMDKMCSLRSEVWSRAWFLTLTYHNDYPNPKGAKQHLRAFFKRVEYYCEKHSLNYDPAMIWRVEPQKRGAPHFHCFVFRAPKIPEYMLEKWWQEITGDPTIDQVKRLMLDDRRKAMNYLNKYISKPDASRIDADTGEIVSSAPVSMPLDRFSKEFISHKRVEKEQGYQLPAGKEFKPSSIIAACEGRLSDEGALLDIALYWAKAGRYWGSEGITDEMYADINEIAVEITHDGLLRFVALLEQTFPFLVGRWSFGFRLFTYDKPADSIWEIAKALLSPALLRASSPSVLQKAVHHWSKNEQFVPWWVVDQLHADDPQWIGGGVDFMSGS